jgi:hypothetical protein
MSDETPGSDLPAQSGGLNIDGKTSIGGNAVGRDSITQTTTNTTTTTVTEGGPVARYAVIGMIVIAALAIVIIALLALQSHPLALTTTPTASATATFPPSLTPSATTLPPPPPTATPTERPTSTPSPTETPLPPSETPTASATTSPTAENTLPPAPIGSPSPTEPATPTATATATEAPAPSATPTLNPTPVLPLYDNFASTCLKKEKWMLDWVWQSPQPTPGAPVCLDTHPQFMAPDPDGGLIVFIDPTVDIAKGVTHLLTASQLGYYRQVDVAFKLNKVEVFTDTRTAYLSAGVSVPLGSSKDADLEIRLQGSNKGGKFAYQVTSVLNLKDGSGSLNGDTPLSYVPGQTVVATFLVKGNKLTAYVDNQAVSASFSILADKLWSVNIGYHLDPQTSLDGVFSEVRILPMPAAEIRPTAAPQNSVQTPSARILIPAPTSHPTRP